MVLGKSRGQSLAALVRMKRLGQSKSDAWLWMCLMVSKVRCCKEQYYIGTCNARPMNQGKLVMVRQEMARLNINVLGIGGQDSFRRNRVVFIVNKRV